MAIQGAETNEDGPSDGPSCAQIILGIFCVGQSLLGLALLVLTGYFMSQSAGSMGFYVVFAIIGAWNFILGICGFLGNKWSILLFIYFWVLLNSVLLIFLLALFIFMHVETIEDEVKYLVEENIAEGYDSLPDAIRDLFSAEEFLDHCNNTVSFEATDDEAIGCWEWMKDQFVASPEAIGGIALGFVALMLITLVLTVIVLGVSEIAKKSIIVSGILFLVVGLFLIAVGAVVLVVLQYMEGAFAGAGVLAVGVILFLTSVTGFIGAYKTRDAAEDRSAGKCWIFTNSFFTLLISLFMLGIAIVAFAGQEQAIEELEGCEQCKYEYMKAQEEYSSYLDENCGTDTDDHDHDHDHERDGHMTTESTTDDDAMNSLYSTYCGVLGYDSPDWERFVLMAGMILDFAGYVAVYMFITLLVQFKASMWFACTQLGTNDDVPGMAPPKKDGEERP